MLDLRQHRALQVCALAAVGEQAIRFWSQQDCRIGVGRIVKRERAADAEFFQFADGDDWPLTASVTPTTLETNPNLTHGQSETCQAQEFREVASSDIGILSRIDGEVAPPRRLIFHLAPVRGNRVKLWVKIARHSLKLPQGC